MCPVLFHCCSLFLVPPTPKVQAPPTLISHHQLAGTPCRVPHSGIGLAGWGISCPQHFGVKLHFRPGSSRSCLGVRVVLGVCCTRYCVVLWCPCWCCAGLSCASLSVLLSCLLLVWSGLALPSHAAPPACLSLVFPPPSDPCLVVGTSKRRDSYAVT